MIISGKQNKPAQISAPYPLPNPQQTRKHKTGFPQLCLSTQEFIKEHWSTLYEQDVSTQISPTGQNTVARHFSHNHKQESCNWSWCIGDVSIDRSSKPFQIAIKLCLHSSVSRSVPFESQAHTKQASRKPVLILHLHSASFFLPPGFNKNKKWIWKSSHRSHHTFQKHCVCGITCRQWL